MLLALVQATVSSLTAGVNYWTGGGPEGGEIGVFAFASSAPSTVYAGAIGGVLLKSTDAGTTWGAVFKGGVSFFDQSLAVAPNDPLTVYSSNADKGLLKTTDGGLSWKPLFPYRRFEGHALATNPDRPEYVYLLSGDLSGQQLNILASTNGGTDWDSIPFPAGVNGLGRLIVTGNPPIMYALAARVGSTSTEHLFIRSTDGGSTWTERSLPESFASMEVDRSDNRVIYGAYSDRVWRSTDGGDTWTVSLDPPLLDMLTIRADPGKPGRVYTLSGNGLYRSENRGVSWELISPLVFRSLAILGNGILLGSTNTRVMRSVDGGASWTDAVSGMTGVKHISQVFPLKTDDGRSVYALAAWGEFFKSIDRGATWREIKTPYGNPIPAPTRPGVLYAIDTGRTLHRSDDEGQTWKSVFSFAEGTAGINLLVSPHDENRVYATLFDRMTTGPFGWATWVKYRASTDGGHSWAEIKAIPSAFHPNLPDTWWSLTNRVTKTTDNGKTLQQLSQFPSTVPGPLRVDPANPDILYLGTADGLLRSTNGAVDWQATGLQVYPAAFDIDPEKASRLVALSWKGTDMIDPEGNHYLQEEWSLVKSEDSGKNWARFDQGLSFPVDFPAILVFGKAHTAYLGNGGPRGVYSVVIDDSLFYPQLTSAATGLFTGLALVNLNGSSVRATIQALAQDGSPVAVEGAANPAEVDVPSGSQWVNLAGVTFGPEFEQKPTEAWAKITGLPPETTSFFSLGSPDLKGLDTVDAGRHTMVSFVFTETAAAPIDTRLRIANPNDLPMRVNLTLFGPDGKPRVQPTTRTIAANGVFVGSLTKLFDSQPAADTYVRVEADLPAVPFEQIVQAGVSVAGLNGQDQGATRLYCPQYAVGGADIVSEVSIVNLDHSAGQVEVRFVGDDGVQVGSARVFPIAAGGKIHLADQTLFGSSDSLQTGYLDIASDGIQLAGSVVFGDPSGSHFRSALPLVQIGSRSLVYSHLVSSQDFFTGIAVVNAGQNAANVRLEVFDQQGHSLASGTITLPAASRRSQLLTEYLPDLKGVVLQSGYIRVTSDEPIHSFALFGANDLRFLAAVPGQSLPN